MPPRKTPEEKQAALAAKQAEKEARDAAKAAAKAEKLAAKEAEKAAKALAKEEVKKEREALKAAEKAAKEAARAELVFFAGHHAWVGEAIDAAMMTEHARQEPRPYLGASRIGDPCERKLGYEYHKTPKDAGAGFPAQVLRAFDAGHDGEARMADRLRLAGFVLNTHADILGTKQIGWEDADGKLKGHVDGVIQFGPGWTTPSTDIEWPAIWENKELKSDKDKKSKCWEKLATGGLEKFSAVYWCQLHLNMAHLRIPRTLFTAENKNDHRIYAEVVEVDMALAQELSDKGLRIVESNKPEELPKLSSDPDWFACAYCDYRMRCHGLTDGGEKKPLARNSWINIKKPTA